MGIIYLRRQVRQARLRTRNNVSIIVLATFWLSTGKVNQRQANLGNLDEDNYSIILYPPFYPTIRERNPTRSLKYVAFDDTIYYTQ